MKLIIVEDEVRLRNSIAYLIPWEEHGIEVIGVYGDGLEGLHWTQHAKPDILLLDIEVPGINGLQLAEQALLLNPSTKIVILSGHDEFKFAQTAIELGISKYLLKPAGDLEILSAVNEAVGQLKREREKQYRRMKLEQKWEENIPRLQEGFLQNWLSGRYDAWEIDRKSEELQLALHSDYVYAVVALDIDPLSEDEQRFSHKDQQLLQFSLLCIVREFASESRTYLSFNDYAGLTILVFTQKSDEQEHEFMSGLNAAVSKLQSLVKDCLKLTASAGIGWLCSGLTIRNSYQQAVQALHERMIYGRDIVIPFRQGLDANQSGAAVSVQQLERKLEAALQTGDRELTMSVVEQLFHAGIESAETKEQIEEYVICLQGLLIRSIQLKGWLVREVVKEDYVYFRNLELLLNKEQIQSWLIRTLRHIIEYDQSNRHENNHEFIREAVRMIDGQLDQEISLYGIAEKLFVSSSYFSRLFKQEIGIPFSQYVTGKKMERAKELLLDGNKVYDTVLMTGYRDISYFTKVFRKYWGITPGECKRK
jgi:two-component system response regulator YesN